MVSIPILLTNITHFLMMAINYTSETAGLSLSLSLLTLLIRGDTIVGACLPFCGDKVVSFLNVYIV